MGLQQLQHDLSEIEAGIKKLKIRMNSLARDDRILPGYGETAGELQYLHKLAEDMRMTLWRHNRVRQGD
jgi:hypothetical protein